jgi:hypothetical protein
VLAGPGVEPGVAGGWCVDDGDRRVAGVTRGWVVARPWGLGPIGHRDRQ